MGKEFTHPCNVEAGLIARLLHELENQGMTVRELRLRLCRLNYDVKAIDAIQGINKEFI